MPGFPENTGRTDYIRKILEQCVVTTASGEDFHVAAIRSYQGAVDSKVSDAVDEASVSHVDESMVEAEKVRADDGSRYVRDDKTPRKLPS